ncbi:MAG: GGDEF domain-containing protein [Aeoliella sp.]
MIPAEIASELLELAADPCAVLHRVTREILWANSAWKAFDESAQAIQSGHAEISQIVHQKPLASILASGGDAPTRQIVAWRVAGRAAFEASVVVYPFHMDKEPVAAVMIVAPRPALQLPTFDATLHTTDPLTGLASRAAIEERIERLEMHPPSETGDLAVLFIDLNGFKQINDRWGHLVGDKVLTAVAARLSGAVRSNDLIARFGGDEFVVLVEGFRRRDELAPLVDRLRKAAEQPIEISEGKVQISASIGLALSSEGKQSLRDLISEADRRMYAEKQIVR